MVPFGYGDIIDVVNKSSKFFYVVDIANLQGQTKGGSMITTISAKKAQPIRFFRGIDYIKDVLVELAVVFSFSFRHVLLLKDLVYWAKRHFIRFSKLCSRYSPLIRINDCFLWQHDFFVERIGTNVDTVSNQGTPDCYGVNIYHFSNVSDGFARLIRFYNQLIEFFRDASLHTHSYTLMNNCEAYFYHKGLA